MVIYPRSWGRPDRRQPGTQLDLAHLPYPAGNVYQGSQSRDRNTERGSNSLCERRRSSSGHRSTSVNREPDRVSRDTGYGDSQPPRSAVPLPDGEDRQQRAETRDAWAPTFRPEYAHPCDQRPAAEPGATLDCASGELERERTGYR